MLDLTESPRHLGQGGALSAPLWGGPPGQGRGRVVWGLTLTKGVLMAASWAQGTRLPGRERAWPILPHVDVTGFLPSLSLPPSLPACFSLLFLSLSVLPPAHPFPRPPYFCCLWLLGAPHSSALPSRLVLPAFSLSAPGGRYTASSLPVTTGEGAGGSDSWARAGQQAQRAESPPGGGPVPGAQARLSLPACLSVCPTRCFVPGPDSPRPCACSASHPLPLPEALTLC